MLTIATAVFDRIVDYLIILSATIVGFMALAVVVKVFVRFTLRIELFGWLLEVTEYGLLFITMMGAAWVLKKEKHVKMDLVLTRLNPKAQLRLNIITSSVCAIICLVFIWYGIRAAWVFHQIGYVTTDQVLWLPKALLVAIIPVGSIPLFIQFIRRTYGYVEKMRELRDSK